MMKADVNNLRSGFESSTCVASIRVSPANQMTNTVPANHSPKLAGRL